MWKLHPCAPPDGRRYQPQNSIIAQCRCNTDLETHAHAASREVRIVNLLTAWLCGFCGKAETGVIQKHMPKAAPAAGESPRPMAVTRIMHEKPLAVMSEPLRPLASQEHPFPSRPQTRPLLRFAIVAKFRRAHTAGLRPGGSRLQQRASSVVAAAAAGRLMCPKAPACEGPRASGGARAKGRPAPAAERSGARGAQAPRGARGPGRDGARGDLQLGAQGDIDDAAGGVLGGRGLRGGEVAGLAVLADRRRRRLPLPRPAPGAVRGGRGGGHGGDDQATEDAGHG